MNKYQLTAKKNELKTLTINKLFFSFFDNPLNNFILSNVTFLLIKKLIESMRTLAIINLEMRISKEAYSSIAFNGKLKSP